METYEFNMRRLSKKELDWLKFRERAYGSKKGII